MTKTPTKPWPELAIEWWVLGAEMSAVIWLRNSPLSLPVSHSHHILKSAPGSTADR